MINFPDYTTTSIQAISTEFKSLAHELEHCINSKSKVEEIETVSHQLVPDSIKSKPIELIPRLPIVR